VARYKLTLEYDGRPFVGWQRQDNGPSVQAAVESAIGKFCGENPIAYAAGRTDAGVHARGQVIHFDLFRSPDPATVRNALNFHLKAVPIAVVQAELADPGFHARFSARQRVYLYRILNRRAPPALDRGRVWWDARPLDALAMAEAAEVLVGRHDFTSFRASLCQAASPVKTLDALQVTRIGAEVQIEAKARSFLHNQVRILVGTLVQVGQGRWKRSDVEAILAARDRGRGGPTAPAEGLYLLRVEY
jgi:tRNA pseudouridine38-40 synthase